MVNCLPVVLAMSESFAVLTHNLLEIVISQSDNSNSKLKQEEAILRVKWDGCGSKPFDGHDTLLLNSENLGPTLRLLKQRQGSDMILLELGDSRLLTGQGFPSGDQKGSKREVRKRPNGRNAAEGESRWDQRRGSHGDVMMEGTTPPGLDD